MVKVSRLFSQLAVVFLSVAFSSSSACQPAILCPEQAKQGQTIEVVANAAQIQFNKHVYKTFPAKGITAGESTPSSADYQSSKVLIAIPADMEPGKYPISTPGSNETKIIKVVSAKFPVQRLTLPKSKDNFIESPGEKERVEAAKSTASADQLWNGAFVKPCKARVSAAFGLRRVVNGRLLKDYFHSGIDYAGFSGTPVKAAQDGKVILAHKGYRLHGNIVCLDHGQGVVSFYLHLKNFSVKEGDHVKAGQTIASVGQSGRANGPHLHFSVYVNGEAANPNDWFYKVF